MARMDSSEEKEMMMTKMKGMMQHREKDAMITWITTSVPKLTEFKRRFFFFVISSTSPQNRLESASIFFTMVLAPRMQMKPSTFCNRPAALLREMSPVTMNAR